jgi:hypothetical protein
MGLLMAYDLAASFGADSEGRNRRRLVTSWKTDRLGEEPWTLGMKAYDALRLENGEHVTKRDLAKFIESSKGYIAEFFRLLEQRFSAGEIVLVDQAGTPLTSLPDWEEADWPWQIMTMGRWAAKVSADAAETVDLMGTHYLVAALCRLDDVVILSDLDDTEGFASSLLEVKWFVDEVDRLLEIDDLTTKGLRRLDSKRASNRAAIRHAQDPKQAAKAVVKECWQAWQSRPESYRTTAAFARAMLDKFPDVLESQPVVERWVRTWKQNP